MTTAEHDLDRRLDAWFAATADADGAPPAEPLARILAGTAGRPPRASVVAGLGSHWVGGSGADIGRGRIRGLRPALLVALLALLAVALTGAGLFIGSRLRETPSPMDSTSLGGFVRAPDLPGPINYPVLAPLPDGSVLVIDGLPNTAFAYDPSSGATEGVGPLLDGAGSTTRLEDGRIFMLGDRTAEVFDPSTRLFSVVGQPLNERRGPGMTVLRDGRVLFVGGIDLGRLALNRPTSLGLFDPRSGTMRNAGSLTMQYGVLATLADGRVFATGDHCCSTEVYDPGTETAHQAGSMPEDLLQGDGCCNATEAIVVPDGRVFVFGTVRMESAGYVAIWDPATEGFTTAWKLPAPVYQARLLRDGRVLLIGGGRPTTWAGVLDPTSGETTAVTPPTAWLPTATTLSDGRVLVAGGLLARGVLPPRQGGRRERHAVSASRWHQRRQRIPVMERDRRVLLRRRTRRRRFRLSGWAHRGGRRPRGGRSAAHLPRGSLERGVHDPPDGLRPRRPRHRDRQRRRVSPR